MVFSKLINIFAPSKPKPFASNPVCILKGDPLISDWSWIHATDPSVAKRFNRWTMYFTSIHDNKLNILQATLPTGSPISDTGWTVDTTPILSPTEGAWDSDATETASYLTYTDSTGKLVERIYYTGWTLAEKNPGGKCNYAIGMAEKKNDVWVKNPTPVLSAYFPWEISNYGSIIGDQSVVCINKKFYMFYQIGTNLGTTILAIAESSDGIYWPGSKRRQIITKPRGYTTNLPSGPYHVTVKVINGKWFFVGWLPKVDLDTQGLWCGIDKTGVSATGIPISYDSIIPMLFENQADWMKPTNIAMQKSHEIGFFGSDIVQDGNKWYLFFHTVNRTADDTNNIGSIGIAELDPAFLK